MPQIRKGSADDAVDRIRVDYVIDSLRRDGTQTVLLNLVSGLAEQGYEQRVICLNDVTNADIVQMLTASGVQVIVIGKGQLITFTGLIRLFVELRRRRPLIVQTFLPFGDTIGRTLARMANVPIVVSSVRARNMDKRWWQFLLDRMTIRWADRVIFNSERVIPFARTHEGVSAEQIVYIPNGVRIEQQDRASIAPRIRSELGIRPGTRVIGMVGRLHPQKGHRFLLAAFAEVLEEKPDTVLLIVGDGPLRGTLEVHAARLGITRQIYFLGERADVPDLLACMDVYVQASTYEGMPNAVMEAMAAGNPVIATDVDGTGELITDGESGWLVAPADAKAMADRIIYVLNNLAEASRIGATAAQRISRDFSVDRMIASYDALYRNLVTRMVTTRTAPGCHSEKRSGAALL